MVGLQVNRVGGVQVDMVDFKVGDRVEFDAKDRVNIGTVISHANAPVVKLEVVVVEVDGEDGVWAIHPDSLRFTQEKTND